MVVFAELLKGTRKEVVFKTYENALKAKGYSTVSFKFTHILKQDGYRTMVMSLDVPVTEVNNVIKIGLSVLGGLCNNIVPDFRMVLEFHPAIIEKTSATDLYRYADVHNSKRVWNKETNIGVDYMFVKRVHSANKNVAFSVVIKNISAELYLTKYDSLVEGLLQLEGVKRIIVA